MYPSESLKYADFHFQVLVLVIWDPLYPALLSFLCFTTHYSQKLVQHEHEYLNVPL